jgi:hypothetical protein
MMTNTSTDTLFVDNKGTTLADLLTIEDCDRAQVWLTDAIVSIENTGATTPGARKALRFRRLALQRVQEKRADLKRALQEGSLLAHIERLSPEIVAAARRSVA